MPSTLPIVSAAHARRLLLGGQCLLDDPERRATPRALRELIRQMGYVQLDSINVVERAHHLTLASRLDEYTPALLHRLLEVDRSLFEHWTHDASAIPTDWFPHWRHRFDRYKQRVRGNKWWRMRIGDDADRVIEHVRSRIERDGPLQSRDFEHDRRGEPGGWWGWKPQKAALEYLWLAGELAIARRVNFQKVYDLTERVLPDVHALDPPPREVHVAWVCRSALDRLGIATAGQIAEFWKAIPVAEARRWCDQAVRRGEVEPVRVAAEAPDTAPLAAYAVADWRARLARKPYSDGAPERIRLLSPFDPVIRDRKRLQDLFNFVYRFEAFVPAPKRVYGYYVMPILHGDRFIGRVDPKFHRPESWLEIRRVWWEPGVRETQRRTAALEAAVNRLALAIGAEHWSLPAARSSS